MEEVLATEIVKSATTARRMMILVFICLFDNAKLHIQTYCHYLHPGPPKVHGSVEPVPPSRGFTLSSVQEEMAAVATSAKTRV